ncbi:O-methyltransferase family 3 [Neofusicoccum parvum]|uniref:O-methyltransferase family 3 n=1 Tax=Neofusicoccum parvum TaxID=310453 RepID=A0ACB5S5U1_9PEZI|nr:O-methyltransferase family 3 [Neofusicoccum parvum]
MQISHVLTSLTISPQQSGATEIALLNHIHALPSLRNNPRAICAAIDAYGATLPDPRCLMTLGADKSRFVTSLFSSSATASSPPAVFLEFGSYVGYSALALGGALRDLSPGRRVRFITFEKTPVMAAITSSLVELAGLKDVVEVHVGAAGESLRRLVAEGSLRKGEVDFMLLDHWKDFYILDLQACEELGVLRKGSVVLADNIVTPGVPEYLAYVRRGVAERSEERWRYETETADFRMPYGGPEDKIAISTVV